MLPEVRSIPTGRPSVSDFNAAEPPLVVARDTGRIYSIKTGDVVTGPIDDVDPRDFNGCVWDGSHDDTLGLQAAMDYCTSGVGTASAGRSRLVLPKGTGNVSASLIPSDYYLNMVGQGKNQSFINFDNVAGGCIVPAALQYWQPHLADFSIIGNSASGKGIDLSNVANEVYNGGFERMAIVSGDDCIYGEKVFSFTFDSITGSSSNGHCFRVKCGPSVSWRNTYAVTAGANKAGYRLAGCVRMYSCNGVDSADYWGAFGSDIVSGTVFQDDFAAVDFPDVKLYGCNIEQFGLCGLWIENSHQKMVMDGGKIDRSNLATAYTALVVARKNSLFAGNPVTFEDVRAFIGAGVPTHYLWSQSNVFFMDVGGGLAAGGVTQYYSDPLVGSYDLISEYTSNPRFAETARAFNAVSTPRVYVTERLSLQSEEHGLTAHAGGGQASALALSATKIVHIVSTVATAADSVKLPASNGSGQTHLVKNLGANAMQLFGSGGDTIDGVAAATGVSVAAGAGVFVTDYASGTWIKTP